jgi:hypothetical protein
MSSADYFFSGDLPAPRLGEREAGIAGASPMRMGECKLIVAVNGNGALPAMIVQRRGATPLSGR